jgi:microcystin-dependent protein
MPALAGNNTIYGSGATTAPMAANATTVSQNTRGGGQAVHNIQPTQVIRFCVALQGIYPSRS